MDDKIIFKIYQSLNQGKKVAMVVITDEIGSSPRKRGSIMAVWEDGSTFGTVGGGNVEYTIIKKALECLRNNKDQGFHYKLKELSMECGGEVSGYIKLFNPKPKLIIAGAGHVAEKLYQLANVLNFDIVIIDDREDYANHMKFPDAYEVIALNINEALSNYTTTEEDFIVIVTRDHKSDKEALKAVINKKYAYIGMIGSVKKIRFIMNDLINEGISIDQLKDVYAPIGLDITNNLPEEIALGILSEILLIKNRGSLNHRKTIKKVWD